MTHGAPGLRLDRPSRGRLSPAYIQTDSLGCNGCGRIIRRWAVGSISLGSLVVSYGFVYGAPPSQAHYLRPPFEDPTGERCGISSYILTEGGGEFFPFCLSRFLTRSGRACDMGGGGWIMYMEKAETSIRYSRVIERGSVRAYRRRHT